MSSAFVDPIRCRRSTRKIQDAGIVRFDAGNPRTPGDAFSLCSSCAPSYALRRVLAIGGLRSCNNQSSAIDNRSAQSIVGYRMDPASGNPSVIGFANQSVNLPRSFIIARVFARERSPDVPAVPRR
jgi:hypothetical protein